MSGKRGANPDRFTVFRMDANDGWLYSELMDGRLRQGWGAPGLELMRDGNRVDKADWEARHRHIGWGEPSPKRFAILSRMLDIRRCDIVVIPKMPCWNQFSIARVSDDYRFEVAGGRGDFGHILPVDSDSVRTFNYQANDDAFLVSGLFSRANHRPAVSVCYGKDHTDAALSLLNTRSSAAVLSPADLSRARMDNAFKEAAKSLQKEVRAWNGKRFEEAVRQAFRDQGYEVKDHPHYDGRGGDVDILVSPPLDRFRLFLPDVGEPIAVQVKWKQGVDLDDEDAIRQIVEGVKLLEHDAVKYIISSASQFTEKAKTTAAENNVVLISGLQTMCFLLGFPERYREDWELDGR